MVFYYRDEVLQLLRPDRRRHQQSLVGPDRRHAPSYVVTSEQYEHLRNCLLQREAVRAKVSTSVRRLRHGLMIVSAAILVLFFSAPESTLSLVLGGASLSIPLVSVAAVAPFIIAYLIVHTCDQARTKMRLGHECQVMDAELRRFGGETSYSVLGRFATECRSDRGLWEQLMAPRLAHWMYGIRDTFFVATIVMALGWSVWLAGSAYYTTFREHPHVVAGFVVYLFASVVASVGSPLLYRMLDRKKGKALDAYLGNLAKLSARSPGPA